METKNQRFTIHQMDEIETLQACLSVVIDLIIPYPDLSFINRDNLASLIEHLTKDHQGINKAKVPDKNYLFVVIDLMTPSENLSLVDRDGLAGLLGYLTGRLQAVTLGES